MGSGYKKLYETSEQERKTLEKLVRAQEREIEILEEEIEAYKESEVKLQKHLDELIEICEEQNQMLRELAGEQESREER